MTIEHTSKINITRWNEQESEEVVVGHMTMTVSFVSYEDNGCRIPAPDTIKINSANGDLMFDGKCSNEAGEAALKHWVSVSGESEEDAIKDGVLANLCELPEQIVRGYYAEKLGYEE